MLERNAFLCLTLLAALSCSNEEPSEASESELPHIEDLSSGASCPEDSELTYDSFGKEFIGKYCLRCHTVSLTAPDRVTPEGRDFDDLALIRTNAHAIDQQAASGPLGNHNSMPPNEPFPAMLQRQRLGQWLACGAPGD
ncbi:MAG TPA: hypothetical protein VJV78_21570 [Polyangiales bacterium]|nr:hypothetical protein [Polyangiales bacterium]